MIPLPMPYLCTWPAEENKLARTYCSTNMSLQDHYFIFGLTEEKKGMDACGGEAMATRPELERSTRSKPEKHLEVEQMD